MHVMSDTPTRDAAHRQHHQIHEFWEHDRKFAVCIECGANWAVVDVEISGVTYEDYEEGDDGDGYCDGP